MPIGFNSSSFVGSNPSTVYWMDIFFTYIFVVKNCNVCLKRPKINKKRPGLAHFFKKNRHEPYFYIKFLKRPKKFWPSFNQLVESEALIFQLVVAKLAQITFYRKRVRERERERESLRLFEADIISFATYFSIQRNILYFT